MILKCGFIFEKNDFVVVVIVIAVISETIFSEANKADYVLSSVLVSCRHIFCSK